MLRLILRNLWVIAAIAAMPVCHAQASRSPAGANADPPGPRAITQRIDPSVEAWPRQPSPYADFDWKKRFLDFDAFIFDWHKKSRFPTIRLDTTHFNMASNTICIPAYYGDKRINHDGWTDGLTIIADVVGSTLCGRKKDRVAVDGHVYDYVAMLRTFKHKYGKRKIVYNWPDPTMVRNQTDWWYDLGPSALYFMAGDLYPHDAGMDARLKDIADGLYTMVKNLGGPHVDFFHQAYNFDTGKPVDSAVFNGKRQSWKCPEAGVVTAVIEYWAYKKFGLRKYRDAAQWCMDFYERIDKNPDYEMSLSFGPYIAARMNAELGTHYHPNRFIDWMIKGSDFRRGYGVSEANWNGFDTYGLVGSRKDSGEGYVFGLESFANAFLAPAVKYDPRLAKTVGKWLLNASNAARFFYADQIPPDHQYYGAAYVNAPEKVIPYEGLRYAQAGQSPRATGDPVALNAVWASYGPAFDVGPVCTDLAIYDGAWAGFFGAIIKDTSVSKILQIDLNKLDFFKSSPCYPSYLYYNPFPSPKSVRIRLSSPSDLFDAVTGRYIARNVAGTRSIRIGANDVVSLVVAPANSRLSYDGKRTLINRVPVAYDPTFGGGGKRSDQPKAEQP